MPLDLGSGQFIPGFEEKLVGTKAGDEVKVEVTFRRIIRWRRCAASRQSSRSRSRRSKAVPTCRRTSWPSCPGLESIDKVRAVIRDRIAEDLGNMTRAKLKRDTLDALDKQYSFELPSKLVDAEFNQIYQRSIAR